MAHRAVDDDIAALSIVGDESVAAAPTRLDPTSTANIRAVIRVVRSMARIAAAAFAGGAAPGTEHIARVSDRRITSRVKRLGPQMDRVRIPAVAGLSGDATSADLCRAPQWKRSFKRSASPRAR
jgi:hypothetical protein